MRPGKLDELQERNIRIALYYLENVTTYRKMGEIFGLSKNGIDSILNKQLRYQAIDLYKAVRDRVRRNRQLQYLKGWVGMQEAKHINGTISAADPQIIARYKNKLNELSKEVVINDNR